VSPIAPGAFPTARITRVPSPAGRPVLGRPGPPPTHCSLLTPRAEPFKRFGADGPLHRTPRALQICDGWPSFPSAREATSTDNQPKIGPLQTRFPFSASREVVPREGRTRVRPPLPHGASTPPPPTPARPQPPRGGPPAAAITFFQFVNRTDICPVAFAHASRAGRPRLHSISRRHSQRDSGEVSPSNPSAARLWPRGARARLQMGLRNLAFFFRTAECRAPRRRGPLGPRVMDPELVPPGPRGQLPAAVTPGVPRAFFSSTCVRGPPARRELMIHLQRAAGAGNRRGAPATGLRAQHWVPGPGISATLGVHGGPVLGDGGPADPG